MASLCLYNLRKTFRFGGRKNVPSIEEIAAISAGRNSKRQMYRLPGGTERIINTSSTTVVLDVIEEICSMLNVRDPLEIEEFSLYCIVEGGEIFKKISPNSLRFPRIFLIFPEFSLFSRKFCPFSRKLYPF